MTRASRGGGSSSSTMLRDDLLIPKRAVQDHRLVRMLCSSKALEVRGVIASLQLMFAVLDTWDVRTTDLRANAAAAKCNIVTTMARYCSWLVLLWMRGFRSKEQQRLHNASRALTPRQQQEEQHSLQTFMCEDLLLELRNVALEVCFFGQQAGSTGTFAAVPAPTVGGSRRQQQHILPNPHLL
ncbi:MAG: hypothetical protein WDW38_000949 [Sanguina aurantia]